MTAPADAAPPRRRVWLGGLYTVRQVVGALGIVVASVLLAAFVVGVFGDRLIRAQARRIGITDPEQVEAIIGGFLQIAAILIAIAGVAAVAAATVFTWFMSRSVTAQVARVRQVAEQISMGDQRARIEGGSRLGLEFEALTDAFNSMAQQLADVEATRARLLADLAHEMRTPVATLDAYLEAIGDGFETADAETVELLRHQTARLARLASDLSLVARVEEGQISLSRRPVDLGDLVRAACQDAQTQFQEAGVTLTADVTAAPGEAVVDGDPDRLGQIVVNLLNNARRHTPAGGSVTVHVPPPAGGVASLIVEDTGEGVEARHLPHLFERFYRVDSARDRGHGGSGIGLTIVKSLAQAHGGSVRAASGGLGQGAEFTVTLPVTTRS